MKRCNTCGITKPTSEYTKRLLTPRKDGSRGTSIKSECKDCASLSRVSRKYDIPKSLYITMLAEQKGVCKICQNPESTIDTRYGKKRTLSVDHCHVTGRIRGLLCENCNRALGLFKDSTDLLKLGIEYLRTGDL